MQREEEGLNNEGHCGGLIVTVTGGEPHGGEIVTRQQRHLQHIQWAKTRNTVESQMPGGTSFSTIELPYEAPSGWGPM